MAVLIDLKPPAASPAETHEIQIIDDLDVLSDDGRCSCSAGDDQPY